ncbi:DsbE family thiol:disulfide interchange protein [Candidatus Nitrosacidococcus tergens]|uniref:Periplasmic thioredoxin of cytochrome c-type biogenesis n=1 Tax=Candidatus Nitrosacidococcus tergens TaxID=553981 RepID=A0A7G1QAJ6_9GAMM|nr:DsbE family thiol:disulfide interchange protein [Candidatus Nitrosacidococcus tergens]CAB1276523.1 periplasmic thioredoxin of cytochrome c-type biogenesis [Candidatus Nitrosacidococcus tergens]
MLRYTTPLVIFVILVVFFAFGLQRDPRKIPSPLIGKDAPEFTVPRLHASNENISRSTLLGKISIVNVWASWCVACRAEHEVLLRLAKERPQLPIIGLNYKDKRDAALNWLADLGNPYTMIAVDIDGRVGMDWGVYGVPESFIVDSGGVIRYKQIGPLTWPVLEKKILPLIESLNTNKG